MSLINPRKGDPSGVMAILNLIGQGQLGSNPEPGIYLIDHFSFGHSIRNKKEDYFDFSDPDTDTYLGAYGVCDTIEQVKNAYAKWLNDSALNFCISFTPVLKADQSRDGGWRWHKWGEYIGTKQPQHEYLYDEGPEIEGVLVYHIYQLLD